MSTYKVIQDIEAEDKLVGPLSFRQFVYFLIAAFFGYLNFISVAKGAPFVLIVLLPPMLFCLFFAWPWTPDQPTEVWALARLRFWFKTRKRVWDQSGVKEFVTITAPKKIERVYTDGLSQTEVRSRLHALAHTLDSRGWAVKNAYVTMPTVVQPSQSDRLIDFSGMTQPVADIDVRASDDILDDVNNPMASHMNSLIDASTRARREELMNRLRDQGASIPPLPAPSNPGWFTQPAAAQAAPVQPVIDIAASQPQTDQLPPKPAKNASATGHLKTVSPVGTNTPAPMPPKTEPAREVETKAKASPSQPDPAILNLAHDNNLDVATLAREAKRARGELDASDGEVVISLH
ncbi:MAG TPA: PrgI family protein [Candidatus Saccharimonadales bacterium]